MHADRDGISDEEARALWRRATELQRSAERREAERPEDGDQRSLPERKGGTLSVDEVLSAAREAGISGDHLLVALAERRLVDAEEIEPDRRSARWLRALVDEADAVEVARLVHAPLERVQDAVAEVTATDAFRMGLEDRLGDAVDGPDVSVYRSRPPSGFHPPAFHRALSLADGRVVVVTLRPEGDGTWIRLRAPLYRRGTNLALTGGATGLFGIGGGAGAAAAGEAVAALIGASSIVPLLGPAVVGAVAGGGVGLWAFRKVYRWGRRKGELALEHLVRAIVTGAEREEVSGSAA